VAFRRWIESPNAFADGAWRGGTEEKPCGLKKFRIESGRQDNHRTIRGGRESADISLCIRCCSAACQPDRLARQTATNDAHRTLNSECCLLKLSSHTQYRVPKDTHCHDRDDDSRADRNATHSHSNGFVDLRVGFEVRPIISEIEHRAELAQHIKGEHAAWPI
jgi:hypothetical protein